MRDRGQGEGSRPMKSARRDGAAETVVGEQNLKKILFKVHRSREGAGKRGLYILGGLFA